MGEYTGQTGSSGPADVGPDMVDPHDIGFPRVTPDVARHEPDRAQDDDRPTDEIPTVVVPAAVSVSVPASSTCCGPTKN